MSLPALKHPQFAVTLPISKQKIHYRPYQVSEEKILLVAMQGGEMNDILESVIKVVENCISEKIEPGKLPIFDVEVIQLLLRIVSTSGEVDLTYLDKEDNQQYSFNLKLQEVIDDNLKDLKAPNREIKLNDEYGVTMKHVCLEMFLNKDLEDINDPVKMYDVLGRTIEKVYSLTDTDEVYFLKDFSSEEINTFVDSFDTKASEAISEYFKNLPTITKTLNYTNSMGTEREIVLSGVNDFFQ